MVSAMPAIEVSGLTKRYGEVTAVDGLDLRVAAGEVFGLLGPNGAGKTTTILMMLGLTEPTSGTIKVAGLDPRRDALAVKRRVGYLPDDVGFYDDLTGRDNLLYTAYLNRLTRGVATGRVDELLAEVGLTEAAERKVGAYSRGMRQRLGLADALVKNPTVLILDEPTVNVDPEGVRELLALVDRLRRERGMTILLSSHLLHQVEQICDRIGIFVKGRLVACGSLDKLSAGVEDRWTIELAFHGSDVDAATLLGVSGVTSAVSENGFWVVTADRDVRGELAEMCARTGHVLVHLARRGADLDAIYHRYFLGAQNDAAA